jgi:LacI family gluconate utilization system Gnt-I transcriptional repressor
MLVGFSNRAAGHAAARYLIGKGHARLGYIGGGDERSLARLQGFRDAVREAGAPEVSSVLLPFPGAPSDASAALVEVMSTARPQAIFCSNDMVAAAALFECSRRRIRVPLDVAIMGFADLPIAAITEPRLTSIQVRAEAMGLRAGAMLLAHLEGAEPQDRVVDLGFAVVERSSA